MRRTTIAAAAVATVITATAGRQAFHRHTPPSSSTTVPVATPSVPESLPGPTTNIARTATPGSVPSAPSPAIPSPVAAAVRFLELDERLFPDTSPGEARRLSDSIAADRSRARLGERAETHQRQILAKGSLDGLTLRLAPIAARTRDLSSTSATVDVYFLRLWSFPSKGALDDYATAEINLVWENGEWRLRDSSVIDGPYPAGRFSARPTLASTAAQFESLLNGFTDEGLVP